MDTARHFRRKRPPSLSGRSFLKCRPGDRVGRAYDLPPALPPWPRHRLQLHGGLQVVVRTIIDDCRVAGTGAFRAKEALVRTKDRAGWSVGSRAVAEAKCSKMTDVQSWVVERTAKYIGFAQHWDQQSSPLARRLGASNMGWRQN
jgi:hypothetical protein